MKEGFFYCRVARPILDLLRQGVTPEKIALSIALGAVLGVFPGIGWTTALCAIASLALRLNLPAIQIVNYFMYPAQIALLIPFFLLGEKLFQAPHLPVSASQLQALIRAGVWRAVRLLWTTTWHAMVAWVLVAPVFVATIYVIVVPLLRKTLRKQGPQAAESP